MTGLLGALMGGGNTVAQTSPLLDAMLKGWMHGTNAPGPTFLSPQEEQRFQSWFGSTPWAKEFERDFQEKPDPNDPGYDYRLAWKSGVHPQMYAGDGRYHWGSSTPDGKALKSMNHPTAWMNKFYQTHGFDPGEK
jgi:hypothetical protein